MTYRIDRSQFIENGPTLAAAAAIARVHNAAIYAALDQRKIETQPANPAPADLAKAA